MILITKGQNGDEGEIGDAERTGENRLEHDESMVDEGVTYRYQVYTIQIYTIH
jgi:hypothetical protein